MVIRRINSKIKERFINNCSEIPGKHLKNSQYISEEDEFEFEERRRFVAARLLKGDRVLVHCAQGRDRSVGVALAVLATCFDEDLALDAERCAAVAAGGTVALDRGRGKELLCRLLNVVVKARPRAEPSRATMKKLHRFFM